VQTSFEDLLGRKKARRDESVETSSLERSSPGGKTTQGQAVQDMERADESSRSQPGESPAEVEFGKSPGENSKARQGTRSRGKSRSRRRSAESLAAHQREISVSEFFAKNRHLLGFDSKARALLTTVKEAVDNALDACEDAGILPTVVVEVQDVGENRYRVAVQDNGPGIVKKQVPKIFGKLLYGSKFHRLKQSRGQQGIGISAAGMYGQLTTGKPVVITSRTGARNPAHHFELVINTKKNAPEVIRDLEAEWDVEHGTRVEIELEGAYKGGRRSLDEYLEQTAIANPHAELFYFPPNGREAKHYPRVSEELPREAEEIKPHPYGVELGFLLKMLKETKARSIKSALMQDFSRVSAKVAEEICSVAGVRPTTRPKTIANRDIEALYKALSQVKIKAPPTSCIVPIGEDLIRKGLEREIREAEFYATRTRPPKVYRGNPFQVEVGLAYGGQLTGLVDHGVEGGQGVWVAGIKLADHKNLELALTAVPGLTRKKAVEMVLQSGVPRAKKVRDLAPDEVDRIRAAVDAAARAEAHSRPVQLVRLANRVPLQYQQAACAITKAVQDVNWKRYGLNQPRGGLPTGPMVLVVHIASVWVPFTSESKEAIAHYPEIIEEIQRGLQECGRELGRYLSKKSQVRAKAQRRNKLDLYSGELVEALHRLTGRPRKEIAATLQAAADRFAAVEELERVS